MEKEDIRDIAWNWRPEFYSLTSRDSDKLEKRLKEKGFSIEIINKIPYRIPLRASAGDIVLFGFNPSEYNQFFFRVKANAVEADLHPHYANLNSLKSYETRKDFKNDTNEKDIDLLKIIGTEYYAPLRKREAAIVATGFLACLSPFAVQDGIKYYQTHKEVNNFVANMSDSAFYGAGIGSVVLFLGLAFSLACLAHSNPFFRKKKF